MNNTSIDNSKIKNLKKQLKNKLYQMANTPKTQIKQLALGTLISTISIIFLTLTSPLENSWLFYGLNALTILGIIIAIPGYIGVWVWRMKKILFKEPFIE